MKNPEDQAALDLERVLSARAAMVSVTVSLHSQIALSPNRSAPSAKRTTQLRNAFASCTILQAADGGLASSVTTCGAGVKFKHAVASSATR